jgi:MinD-like ATPase involved in chromosome partitioning or flagellar assembly
MLSMKQIEAAIGTKIEAEIPYDPGLYLKAINEGIPIVRSAPTSPPARALARLAAIAIGRPDEGATSRDEHRGRLGAFRRRG